MTPADLFAALEATWPAAARHRVGPWIVREGRGGGQRVSATSAAAAWADGDIAEAEAAMERLGQPLLFMVRPDEAALDSALATRGYRLHDPVAVYAASCDLLGDPAPDPMAAFPHWPPLAIVQDIWADGGIGAGRLAVMHRVTGPKTALLGRNSDRPAGAAFVAVHDRIAMVHAVEVTAPMRRRGVAQALLRRAALWAQDQGATTLALVVTEANSAACALYSSLGMGVAGQYHYRLK